MVGEEINEGIRQLRIECRRGIRERRIRKRGEEGGLSFFGKLWKKNKGRKRRLEGKDCFGVVLLGHCCCWEFWDWVPGNRKDSWR
jgi:hypothetical protein